MKRHVAIRILVAALSAGLVGCGKGSKPPHEGHNAAGKEDGGMKMTGMVEGFTDRMAVQITPAQRQLINVRTAPVRREKINKTIRTVGIVTYDTSRVVDVNTKIGGWAQKLYVDKPGQLVKKGDPLMDIYSRDLYSGQYEYLQAYRQYQRLKDSPVAKEASEKFWKENLAEAESLRDSARKRLLLWDISEAEIRALEESGKPTDTLKLVAPVTGYVIEKKIEPGQAVHAGMMLYRAADVSTVWVNADIYEYELPLVKVGQEAHVTLTAYPDRKSKGKVDFIYPYLENKTRTATIRLVLDNQDEVLKPDMYANVRIEEDLGEQLVVPAAAVLDTGVRQYVFVETAEGMYAPRMVKLGQRTGDLYVIRDGLKDGEQVVVDGNFMLDSESQLSASGMGGGMAGMKGMGK
jgi:Cu(I)/Ag(I) efflux system membrane fusion protein